MRTGKEGKIVVTEKVTSWTGVNCDGIPVDELLELEKEKRQDFNEHLVKKFATEVDNECDVPMSSYFVVSPKAFNHQMMYNGATREVCNVHGTRVDYISDVLPVWDYMKKRIVEDRKGAEQQFKRFYDEYGE